MKSARELFQESPHAKAWHDLTASDMWASAIATTKAEVAAQANPTDPTFGAKMTGVLLALTTLTNLTEPAHEPAPMRKLK